MSIEHLGEISLPQKELPEGSLVHKTEALFEKSNVMGENIEIREMSIDGSVISEDIALITAAEDTTVQRYEGEGAMCEVMYCAFKTGTGIEIPETETYIPLVYMPIGVIKMSPEGEMSLYVYDPRVDGGQRGFTVPKGWTMQLVIPQGTTLRFFDYWSPRGFDAPGDKKEYYGWEAEVEVDDPIVLEKFKEARSELMEHLGSIV